MDKPRFLKIAKKLAETYMRMKGLDSMVDQTYNNCETGEEMEGMFNACLEVECEIDCLLEDLCQAYYEYEDVSPDGEVPA